MKRKYKNKTLPKGILVDRGLVYVRIFKDGKPFRESFGSAEDPANINLAVEKLTEYRAAIQAEKFGLEPATKRILTEDAVDLFLSRRKSQAYLSQLKSFRERFTGVFYDTLTPALLEAYRDYRIEKGRNPATTNREFTAISAMYYSLKRGVELREINPPVKIPAISPVKYLKRYDERLNRRTRHLSPEEFQSFMATATPLVQRACLGALNTALRRKDLLALEEGNRVEEGLRGLQNKVGTAYVVPENQNVLRFFQAGGAGSNEHKLEWEFRKSRQAWLEAFPEAEREARYFKFMDLRRTALRRVYEETKDILLCKDLAGHTDVRTTQLYLGITAKDLAKAGEVLAKAFSFEIVGKSVNDGKQIGFKIDEKDSEATTSAGGGTADTLASGAENSSQNT